MLPINHVNVALIGAKNSESCGAVSNNVGTGGGLVLQTGFLKMDSSYVAAH